MQALELASVTQRYGKRTALERVSFSLASGASLGLLGANGAGKTTALRLLLGLLQPTEGEARLQGLDPLDAESRRGVGYLPERLRLPARMSVRGFLALHASLAGVADGARDQAVAQVAATTGVAERLGDRLGTLSKGLAQRVGFAQALLGRPRVLLLDEPSSGLDPLGLREARGWIEAARADGAAVLISSHLLSEVERLCDELVILDEGRVVAQGALGTVVRDGESLEDAFVRHVGGAAGKRP